MKSDDYKPFKDNHMLVNHPDVNSVESLMNKRIKVKGDDLTQLNIVAYGVGHMLNDLTATCWFSFLLYYLTEIVNLDKHKAGYVMLSGQIFDGIATPLVGIFSDKYNTRIGRRTPWYLGGTVGVILCFSLIFQRCRFCSNSSNPEVYEMIYYITLPSLFNIAWAAVQVSHMALLPSISINKKSRDYMVRLRTAFTFTSQMLCLIFSFIIFYYVTDKYQQYSILSLVCVLVGTISSLFFIIFCREVDLSKNIPKYYDQMKGALIRYQNLSASSLMESREGNQNYNTIEMNEIEQNVNQTPASYGVLYWLKKPLFYKYIVIYMLVRLSINVTCSMLPYYLENVLGINKTKYGGTPIQISLIYIFSTSGCLFNSLFLQKYLERYNSRVVLMFSAWIFTVLGLGPVVFLHRSLTTPIFLLAFIFGIGFALGLSTASSLINDVVGSKGDHGAFVYGAYSLADKFSCGILLYIFVDYVKDDNILLKYVVPLLPIVSIFLSLVIVCQKKKKKNEDEKEEVELNTSKSLIDNSKFSFASVS